MRSTFEMLAAAALAALAFASPARAITAVAGYAVRTIPMPGGATTQGGVVRRGDLIIVGEGPTFTAGAQSIVRFGEGGSATTIATGFNSLGGFALDAAGTLYIVDNCLTDMFENCGTTATGDTVYAIPDALTRTTAVTAAGQEVVPAGTIEGASDVLVAPDGALLVSDSAASRVVRVAGNPPAATDLITGLDIAAGLALTADGTLLVGNCVFDFNTFTCNPGEVLEYQLDGTPIGTLTDQLSGVFAVEPDGDGNVLVSGIPPFLASKVVAVASNGGVADRAGGFAFSGDLFFDAVRDETLVLDSEGTAITAICRDGDGDGVCDVDDDCPADADAGQTDSDGDGLGDVCDPCTGAALAPAKLTAGKLQLPAGDESLALKGAMTLPVAPAIDPVTKGLRVIVRTAAGVLIDTTLPSGAFDPVSKTGWRSKNGKYGYQGPGGPLGSARAKVATFPRNPGLVKVTVMGKSGTLALDPASPPIAATFVLDAAAGQCGDAAFPPSPAPACKTTGRGKGVQCKG